MPAASRGARSASCKPENTPLCCFLDNETNVEVIRQDVGDAELSEATGSEACPLPLECALLAPPLLQRQACPGVQPLATCVA